jgi:hypothetical protein
MKERIGILINALGVSDSGGVSVLDKLLHECTMNNSQSYWIVCNENDNVNSLIKKFRIFDNINFNVVPYQGFIYRLYYENILLKKLMNRKIDLIYNFTGSFQPWIGKPQIIKVHNLMFYSAILDKFYKEQGQFFLWFKQVFFKRIFFKFMLNKAKYIEIQSSHVKDYLNEFIDIRNKFFFIKSDINVHEDEFLTPKQYDFSKRIKFLYIVGPHFKYPHKNLSDFSKAMLSLKKQGVDFEIDITLSLDQLGTSKEWDSELNKQTNFLGYIDNKKAINELFCNNTILISTSVVETLGLHVIEGIKNGVIVITPDEKYADIVYGKNRFTYSLFSDSSLLYTINSVIDYSKSFDKKIFSQQDYLKISEGGKFKNINNVFNEVLNV